MANWLLPTEDSLYLDDLLDRLKERDFDSGSLFLNAPTNPVAGMIKYVRASSKFQEYNGATWDDKLIALAGGGTGAATAADARTNLGLGTIATQPANNVNITGGNLAGSGSGLTNLNADNLASGTLPAARFPAVLPAASGVNLTALNASNLASGTIPNGRFPAILPALNGTFLTDLNGSAITSGTVNQARLGSGGGGAAKFLREDNTWQDVSVIKSIQLVTIAYTASVEGNIDTTLGTTLTNYLNAVVVGISGLGAISWTIRIISNTTIRMNIPATLGVGGARTIYCYVVEYKNVG